MIPILRRAPVLPALLVLVAGAASASQPPRPLQRLLDLTPERLDAFRSALRDFGDYMLVDDADGLWLESSYRTPTEVPERRAHDAGADDLRVPVGVQGRDLVAEERFLIAGREDDFEDAARWWVERQLKGESGITGSGGGSPGIQPRYGWNGGPELGFRLGRVTTMVRQDGWKVRWSHGWASRPGWATRVSCGVNDGDERVALTVGRSLFRSRTQ